MQIDVAAIAASVIVQPVADPSADLVEKIVQEIVGNKHIRYRSGPDDAQRAHIKVIVQKYVDADYSPINFLVPSGSEKPDGSDIDLGEFCMLQSIANLRKRIQRWYPPGIVVNVRIEDASAPYLFQGKEKEAQADAEKYSSKFVKLIEAMRMSGFIKARRETAKISYDGFTAFASKYEETIYQHLINPHDCDTREELKAIGWKGEITAEMVNYYKDCYLRLYPQLNNEQIIRTLARYFASALARYVLGVSGTDEGWGADYICLCYYQQVPGAPNRLNDVRYRTIPGNVSTVHGAPWRMRGYIQRNTMTPRLASLRANINAEKHTIKVGDVEINAYFGD